MYTYIHKNQIISGGSSILLTDYPVTFLPLKISCFPYSRIYSFRNAFKKTLSSLVSYEFLFLLLSDSPYSEHGTLEEVDQDAGTEPHTSEDGMPCVHATIKPVFLSFIP
jgi:hypothetical protein